MKKLLFLLFILANTISLSAQKTNIYEQCFFLTDSIECNSIYEALIHLKKGKFNKPFGNNIYHNIPKNKNIWFHFQLPQSNNNLYFTIANSYLHHGKIYTHSTKGIDSLATLNYFDKLGFKNVFYRHPTWKLKANTTSTDYFIEIRDDEPKARLELLLNTPNEFLKRNQIEYYLLGTTITFLSTLILIIIALFASQKQYSLLWYGGFIFFLIIVILANKGVGVQYLWSTSDFLIQSSKSFSQTLATMCAAFFYANFYPLKDKHHRLKKTLLGIGYICAALSCVYIYKMLFGGLVHWYLFVWFVLKAALIGIACIHLYLLIQKTIPAYLAFVFVFSILGTFIYQLYNPVQNSSLLTSYFFTDIFYLMVIIELTLVMYYIISEIVRGKLRSITLEQENLNLRSSLQNIEDTQKHKFSSNIHDTFGSYIEALNLQVLTNPDTQTLHAIISSFRKEYNILLTNMFIPKITKNNFREAIQNYCQKIDQISPLKISLSYINKRQLSLSKIQAQETYKIITELTTNAIKHSQAKHLSIQIMYYPNLLLLEVTDDGIGFLTTQSNKGIGLDSIHNRVQLLKGELNITSELNKGTTTRITLPFNTSTQTL